MSAPFNLDETDRLLSTTRAVRKRLDLEKPVERAVILDCIRLSQQAPTASNTQKWCWMVVTDPEKRRAVGEIYARGKPFIEDARSQRCPDTPGLRLSGMAARPHGRSAGSGHSVCRGADP